MKTEFSQRQIILLISAAIVVMTLVAYEPIRHNNFVNYDDGVYITENPHVTGGITRQSIAWAFTSGTYVSYWHPLTWLSHMLDCEIYGLNPLGHHITSMLIHIVNSLLLFWLLQKTTGAIWKSAFVAAIFALHPLHVESVAWAAERKDVLSGLFWMLTMLGYAHYVKKPGVSRYMLVAAAFVMGLMSKPMAVTLPFVLILLDYWPLNRIQNSKFSILNSIYEKVPLFVLSAAVCVITVVAQKHAGALVSTKTWPLYIRPINALGCYFNYVVKIVYPKGLAVLYPLPEDIMSAAAAVALAGIVVLLALGRGRRWLVAGLLWYLGTLVPVVGLVQSGAQIMADRYTYLPSIGIFIIIVWGAAELFVKLRYAKGAAAIAVAASLIVMVLLTRIQTSYWKNTASLYERAIAVTKNNFVMLSNYGQYLCEEGKYNEAIRYSQEAARIRPEYQPARKTIYVALLSQNKFNEAVSYLTRTLQERDDWPAMEEMYNDLGWAYGQKGDLSPAETNFRRALAINPEYEPARENLAMVLAAQSKTREASQIGKSSQQK
jgi:Tfp pilus assembly protein PilF